MLIAPATNEVRSLSVTPSPKGLSRRGFISGLIAFPAIVKASSLMRVAAIVEPSDYITLDEYAERIMGPMIEAMHKAQFDLTLHGNELLRDIPYIPRGVQTLRQPGATKCRMDKRLAAWDDPGVGRGAGPNGE